MESLSPYLVPIALGAVFLTLMAGIYTLFWGGVTARRFSNKLMRLRVLLQFVAIIMLLAAAWLAAF